MLSLFSQIFDTVRLGRLLSDFFDHRGSARRRVQGAMIAIDPRRMRHQFHTFCDVDLFFQWLDWQFLQVSKNR